MSRELDEQCARALGYWVYHYDKDHANNCYYQLLDQDLSPVELLSYRAELRKTETEAWADAPNFSSDSCAASILEDEIERRGLQSKYTTALVQIVAPETEKVTSHLYYADDDDFWSLIRATPEQRARAFLEAIK